MGKEFSSIVDAIEDVRQGKMIVIVDDEYRENEGDLINIECDMIGKYVYKACQTLMKPESAGSILDVLKQQEKE